MHYTISTSFYHQSTRLHNAHYLYLQKNIILITELVIDHITNKKYVLV